MTTWNRREVGRLGEDLAVRLIRSQGLEVVERNWRDGRRGEIDVVARHPEGTLAVVEVKTRTSEQCGQAVEAVDGRKLARMRAVAAAWLRSHGSTGSHADVRFDVIGVTLDVTGSPVTARMTWTKDVRP